MPKGIKKQRQNIYIELALPKLHKQVFKIGEVCREHFAQLSELFTFTTKLTGDDAINLCFQNHKQFKINVN